MGKKITIAIDAMGGDNSPAKTIQGVHYFLEKNKSNNDYLIHLYGDSSKISYEINKFKIPSDLVKIVHTDGVVSDEETPLTAIKNSRAEGKEFAIFEQDVSGFIYLRKPKVNS